MSSGGGVAKLRQGEEVMGGEMGMVIGAVVGLSLCSSGIVYNALIGEIRRVKNQRDHLMNRVDALEAETEVHRDKLKMQDSQMASCVKFLADSDESIKKVNESVKVMRTYYDRIRHIEGP